MKIDLCKIFGVEEKQHFWLKYKSENSVDECFIEDNKIWSIGGDCTGSLARLDLLDIKEVYYKKPIFLTENTKQFLKLVKKDYKYLARDNGITLCLSAEKPKKNNSIGMWDAFPKYIVIKDEAFDIDLSFIKWEDEEPTLIADLLKESDE